MDDGDKPAEGQFSVARDDENGGGDATQTSPLAAPLQQQTQDQPPILDAAFVAHFFGVDEAVVQQLPAALSHKLAAQAQKYEVLKSEKMMGEVNFGEYDTEGDRRQEAWMD